MKHPVIGGRRQKKPKDPQLAVRWMNSNHVWVPADTFGGHRKQNLKRCERVRLPGGPSEGGKREEQPLI